MREQQDIVVIGGGQAGLAMSRVLQQQGREHVVLERGRVGERWRTERWDSLRFQFPNWTLQLPDYTYQGQQIPSFRRPRGRVPPSPLPPRTTPASAPIRSDWPKTTITGAGQENRLLDGFKNSTQPWDILGQQVFFAERDRDKAPEIDDVSMDGWDGYAASRRPVSTKASFAIQDGVPGMVARG